MGFRIRNSHWRDPLQIIDSLLPTRQPPKVGRSAASTSPSVRAFLKAGWLRGKTTAAAGIGKTSCSARTSSQTIGTSSSQSKGAAVRIIQQDRNPMTTSRPEARLVISGRIGDVCAELDRLVAMEANLGTH